MSKVIILEGPDGGGKTTLARSLEKLGWIYKHEGPPPAGRDQVAHYLEILNDSIESPHNTVHDRLWLGERIYGRIARNNDTLGELGQKLFMRLHNSKQIHQFLCMPGITTAMANYEAKINDPHDYLKSVDKFEKVYNSYLMWFHVHGSSGDIYDYHHSSIVMDVLGREFYQNPLPRGSVGHPYAEYLFIGDKPNHPTIDVPFHAKNGSSGYFNEALRLVGIPEENIAISNARDPFNHPHNALVLLNSLPVIKEVFLMGGVAQDWWKNSENLFLYPRLNRLKIHHMEHPSYLKRFHGNNPRLMAEKIGELI